MTLERLLLPSMLFGPYAKVKSEWMKLLRATVKAGPISGILDNCPLTDVTDSDVPIVLTNFGFHAYERADTWKTYAITELTADHLWGRLKRIESNGTLEREVAVVEEYEALNVSGIRHLWFALAKLGQPATFGNLRHRTREEFRIRQGVPKARMFVHWLSELIHYTPRFSGPLMLDQQHTPWDKWPGSVAASVAIAYDSKELFERLNGSAAELPGKLLAEGLVREVDGRLELIDPK